MILCLAVDFPGSVWLLPVAVFLLFLSPASLFVAVFFHPGSVPVKWSTVPAALAMPGLWTLLLIARLPSANSG